MVSGGPSVAKLILFVLVFGSYAYFSQSPTTPNALSRMALALSLVEYGELNIDRYADKTLDKARRGKHFYLDKAPGMSLMALPVVYALHAGSGVGDAAPRYLRGGVFTPAFFRVSYLSTLLASSLLPALAVVSFYGLAMRLGAGPPGALLGALGYGLAGPTWGWATVFAGHAAAGALLFIAFAYGHRLGDRDGSKRLWPAVVTGAALGWAVVTEYSTAPAALLLGVYALLQLRRFPGIRYQVALAGVLASLAALTPMLVYHTLAFGSPFQVGYQAVQGFEHMQDGLFGLTYPKLPVLWELLLGSYRGLLPLSPGLLMLPLGVVAMLRGPGRRGPLAMAVLMSLYYLLLNASYHYWDGGWSTGPRHLVPMLPFLTLPLAFVWSREEGVSRLLLMFLLALGAAISLVCVSVTMFSPEGFPAPFARLLLPGFLAGDSRSAPALFFHWDGHISLLPLFAGWLAAGFALWRTLNRPAPAADNRLTDPLPDATPSLAATHTRRPAKTLSH